MKNSFLWVEWSSVISHVGKAALDAPRSPGGGRIVLVRHLRVGVVHWMVAVGVGLMLAHD